MRGRYEVEKADFRDGRYYYGSIGDIAEGEERGWPEYGSLLTVPTRMPHPQVPGLHSTRLMQMALRTF